MTFETLKRRDEGRMSWNKMQVDFWRLSTSHSQYLTVKAFCDDLADQRRKVALDDESQRVLWKVFKLYCICIVETASHEFYVSSALSVQQVEEMMRIVKPQLLEDMAPHAVRLVDAWNLPDWLLDSSLGGYEGRVYEDLFYRASQLNPLNIMKPEMSRDKL